MLQKHKTTPISFFQYQAGTKGYAQVFFNCIEKNPFRLEDAQVVPYNEGCQGGSNLE
jgi:hypothetical protein